MKNILNHDGTSQLLLSNVDDGSNRIVINDVEIPSSSWVGTGNYTQTISGTTITIAKVADLDGNVMLQLVSANTYRLVKYVKAEYLTTTGDTKDNVTTFQSSDTTDALATAWTSVTKLDSGEKQSSIFAKMSQMFKNIRYLYKMLGTTDISQIGGGNVTGAISALNTSLTNQLGNHTVAKDVPSNAVFTDTWRANNKTTAGYVPAPNSIAWYLYMTNASGDPAWRVSVETFNLANKHSKLAIADASGYNDGANMCIALFSKRIIIIRVSFNVSGGAIGASENLFSVPSDVYPRNNVRTHLKSTVAADQASMPFIRYTNGYCQNSTAALTNGAMLTIFAIYTRF